VSTNLPKHFKKFCLVGVAEISEDERADMAKLVTAFRNSFANVPKKLAFAD
jgi:hypothetical protein